jgi:hypothetical protein
MAALAASERGLFSLISVIERGRMLPAGELRELVAVANQSAATMAATADEVVSMERAAAHAPQSRAYLSPTIAAFTAQLDNGARQYNDMVAAAQLVSAASQSDGAGHMPQQRYRAELVNATDRLTGWAKAFEELGQLKRA